LHEEQALWAAGYPLVAGIDEAGRGAWAGPVVAAAVILAAQPNDAVPAPLAGVRDSKLLSPRQREACYAVVRQLAVAVGVGVVPSLEIDAVGIVAATRAAMACAVAELSAAPDYLIIDALRLPHLSVPQKAIIKGDRYCLSIAAASIIAKVTRDRLLRALDETYPSYGFGRHKGYGTEIHRKALGALGPCPEHRRTYAPIRALLEPAGA
jgi:ribonuclease HII